MAVWRQVIEVNLTGSFLCCRSVVPRMIAAGYGRIVNIASVAGKEGNPNAAHYSASKAGLIGLTKSLGKELAKTGVLVNAVTPAAAKTAIFDSMRSTSACEGPGAVRAWAGAERRCARRSCISADGTGRGRVAPRSASVMRLT